MITKELRELDALSNAEVFQLVKEKFGVEVKDKDDIAAAWAVVEKILEERYMSFGIAKTPISYWIAEFNRKRKIFDGKAETAPLAICRAALAAVEQQK